MKAGLTVVSLSVQNFFQLVEFVQRFDGREGV
jgi:hypothetical protein